MSVRPEGGGESPCLGVSAPGVPTTGPIVEVEAERSTEPEVSRDNREDIDAAAESSGTVEGTEEGINWPARA